MFTFDPGDGGGDDGDDGDLAYEGAPDWDANGDGVLDNYNDYENSGSITAIVSVDGIANYTAEGDMIAAFVGDEQRGVSPAYEVPPFFGGGYNFQMLMYSNQTDGETLTFQYYDYSEDAVYNLSETMEFVANMVVADSFNPYMFTFDPGDGGGDDCPSGIYDCAGICDGTAEEDCAGECNGDAVVDDCGVCDGNNIDQDCAGDCNGDALEDNCGVCDDLPWNDCEQDCAGEWGGDAIVDECGICEGSGLNEDGCCGDEIPDCTGECGGTEQIDECGICGGEDLNENGFCDPTCPENYILNPQYPNVADDFVCVPSLFAYNISTLAAGYLFQQVTIQGSILDHNDWVGAFNDNVCVGSQLWNTDNCAGGVCSISVMGYDASSFTDGYMLNGDIPVFKIYDASENIYYDAYPTENVAWENFGFADIALLSTQPQGCTDELACNYDENALEDNDSCEYPPDNFNCEGDCIAEGDNLIDGFDCNGICGGSAESDQCGICEGDDSSCSGCTNSEALNYNPDAIIDDGSCVFDYDLPPELFEFTQSTMQAFYFFEVASIDQIPLDDSDWVAAFKGDVCVGSRRWNSILCNAGVCDVPAMGDDGSSYSEGYMNSGDIPTFKIYDYSEETFYDAIASENVPWENNGLFILEYLNVFPDCAGVLGGDSELDDCGVCDGGNADQDCSGECFGYHGFGYSRWLPCSRIPWNYSISK